MLLDRIDIDAHGPLARVELGPFSEHLNVIHGAPASGKTAIVRFIRDSLVDREYPLGMLSSSAGRIVWADRHGLVQCRRETDGTARGRRTFEFERRGGFDHGAVHPGPIGDLGPIGRTADDGGWLAGTGFWDDDQMARQMIRVPESLVDGIMTDTSVSRVARVVASAIAGGLDRDELHRDLPLHHDSFTTAHTDLESARYDDGLSALRAELADIDAELARAGDHWRWESPGSLAADLDARSTDFSRRDSLRHSLQSRHHEAHGLRIRREEMRRWLTVIDRDLDAAMREGRAHDRYQSLEQAPGYLYRGSIDDTTVRNELDRIDDEMLQVRRIMEQIRDLGTVVAEAGKSSPPVWSTPWDAAAIADSRYRSFVHAIDHYGSAYDWRQAPIDDFWTRAAEHGGRPYRSIYEIDARIESACSQIESLIRRVSGTSAPLGWDHAAADTPVARLRAIRHDLESVRWDSSDSSRYSAQSRFELLDRDARWLGETLQKMGHHREHLLRRAAEARQRGPLDTSWVRQAEYYALAHDRKRCVAELRQLDDQLHRVLADAAELRRDMRHLPIADSIPVEQLGSRWMDRSRVEWLQRRRLELLTRLQSTVPVTSSRGPLAEVASRWLVRLSGGRLRRVDWNRHQAHQSSPTTAFDSISVTIDGRDESACDVHQRTLASMAVRMAAGQLMSQLGRPIPLILEVGESDRHLGSHDASLGYRDAALGYADHGPIGRLNDPIAAALRDYCGEGRQIILLTSDDALAGQLSRVGARNYRLLPQRTVHATRPMWRPGQETDTYVGPLDSYLSRFDDREFAVPHADAIRYDDNQVRRGRRDEANRAFDAAWLEQTSDARPRTDWALPESRYRNGFDYADRYTTSPHADSYRYDSADGLSGRSVPKSSESADVFSAGSDASETMSVDWKPANPYFLSVDSPIDQAPSIDAVAASRLRNLKVTHVNHLMQRDSNRLADALGLTHVDANTVRRWQSECRLVCQVPQLRGFDARVLVGCGVTTPAQLASIDPVDLLRDVEAFLATGHGQQILRSGSSQELSRLTSWIAAANAGFHQDADAFDSDRYEVTSDGRRVRRRRFLVDADGNRIKMIDEEDENDWGVVDQGDRVSRSRDGRSSSRRSERSRSRRSGDRDGRSDRSSGRRSARASSDRSGEYRSSSSSRRSSSRRSTSSDRSSSSSRSGSSSRYGSSSRSQSSSSRRERSDRDGDRRSSRDRDSVVRYQRDERAERSDRQHEARSSDSGERELRFYLHRQDPVVDAPSIGPRMAARLEAIGIVTVDDLLTTDAESIAESLDYRRVDADVVRSWQHQTTLCCRIPMLRGHDAQLLVAAEITTPEQMSQYTAEELFAIIEPIALSPEGKRIVRGGSIPDLDEVSDWIRFAGHHRDLQAA